MARSSNQETQLIEEHKVVALRNIYAEFQRLNTTLDRLVEIAEEKHHV